MKHLILTLLLSIPFALNAKTWGAYDAEYVDNYDGDSITIRFEVWSDVWVERSVRLDGVDTPERGWRAACDSEREKAELAANLVKVALSGAQSISVIVYETGKYGRLLVDIRYDGADLASTLIENEVARPYYGGKREGWC